METLRIDVKGWPDTYVKLVESYAAQVRKTAERTGERSESLPDLPVWAGISLSSKDVRKAAYGDE